MYNPPVKEPPIEHPFMKEIINTTDIQFITRTGLNGRATVCRGLIRYPKGFFFFFFNLFF